MTKITTGLALAILLLQAGEARAQCPTSGGNLSETRIDLNVNDTPPMAVLVQGMDAFPDCESTVWIEYFTSEGSASGVGIGFSTLTRERDRKGRIAYADATGSKLNFRLRDESYIDGRNFKVVLGVRVVGSGGGGGQLYMSEPMQVVVAKTGEPPEPPEPTNRPAQGQLRILGQTLEGSTLTADHAGITDADGKPSNPSSYSYTWKYTDQSNEVSSAASIRLDSPRLGKQLEACVSFNDNRGGAEGAFCATSGKILNAPNGRWGEPSIRHAGDNRDHSAPLAVVGNVLFAESARITDPDGFDGVDPGDYFPRPNFNYQWVHVSTGGSSVLIPGATRQTHEVGATDLNKRLAVEATYTDGLGVREAVYGDPIGPVTSRPTDPPTTSSVDLQGTLRISIPNGLLVGQTISADTSGVRNGTRNLDLNNVLYQWYTNTRPTRGTPRNIEIRDATERELELSQNLIEQPVMVAIGHIDDAGERIESAWTELVTTAPIDGGIPLFVGSRSNGCGLGHAGNTRISHAIKPGMALLACHDSENYRPDTESYQWLHVTGGTEVRDGNYEYATESAIPRAVDTWYTVRPSDAGKQIAVRMKYLDRRTAARSPTSGPAGVADAGPPTITAAGPIQIGTELTANLATDPAGIDDDTVKYQWQRSASTTDLALSDIRNETEPTYTLVDADTGHFLAVKVSYTDNLGTREEGVSALQPTTYSDSGPTGRPTITGIAKVGETLKASTSQVADPNGMPDDVHERLDWHVYSAAGDYDAGSLLKRGMAGGTKKTNTTYKIGADEVGSSIVTLLRNGWMDSLGNLNDQLASSPTAVVRTTGDNQRATGPVVLRGDNGDEPAVGGILRVDDSQIDDPDGLTSPTYFSYTWYAHGRIVEGANDQVWSIGTGREGQAILVRVQFVDAGGITEALYSNLVWVHERPDATGAPVVKGDPQIGETLSVDLSKIRDRRGVDTRSFEYQWRRRDDPRASSRDIQGATTARYQLTPFDYGKFVGVVVNFRDRRGSLESLESEYIGAVIQSRTSQQATIAVEGRQARPDGSYMVELGTPVQLMAMPRTGEDANEVSYEWTTTSGNLDSSTSTLTTWIPMEHGTHEISVIVRDETGAATTTSVIIETATPVPALPLTGLIVLALVLIRLGSRTHI